MNADDYDRRYMIDTMMKESFTEYMWKMAVKRTLTEAEPSLSFALEAA
jgi:hypothetical protein